MCIVIDYTGADNQRWFIKQGTNGLILIPKCAINSCLDIANGFTAVGTNAWLWTQNGTAAQEFNVYKEGYNKARHGKCYFIK